MCVTELCEQAQFFTKLWLDTFSTPALRVDCPLLPMTRCGMCLTYLILIYSLNLVGSWRVSKIVYPFAQRVNSVNSQTPRYSRSVNLPDTVIACPAHSLPSAPLKGLEIVVQCWFRLRLTSPLKLSTQCERELRLADSAVFDAPADFALDVYAKDGRAKTSPEGL
jgi:hypothetical protein